MIEAVDKSNLDDVLPLIRGYQEFYHVENICDEHNRKFFSQFGEEQPIGCQFIYRSNGAVVAFATVYFTFTSTIADKVAVMNDLFTLEHVRGQGIGRELIEYCREYAKAQGAARLQWMTATDNVRAQVLYDKLGAKKSTWHFYSYPI